MFAAKSYELPITKDYIRHWGLLEGIRELIQNALDSESPFEWDLEGDTLYIHSRFSKLAPKTLLLGTTTKADNKEKIGAFGEGYKLAMLVLHREGYGVRIVNNGVIWQPEFRLSTRYDTEILYVIETANPQRNEGVTFQVSGLSNEDIGAIRMSCLQMQEHVGQLKRTSKGEILLEQQGRLYVGGLYICDTDLKYGYNIKPEFVTLERDRRTVDSWDLKTVTRDMWFETQDYEMICELIEKGIPDTEYAQYSCPEIIKEAVYKYFRAQHPGTVIASNQAELERLVEQGMKVYVGGYVYHSVVTSAPGYKEEFKRPAVRMVTPTDYLKKWFEHNRKNMRRPAIVNMKKLIKESENWKLK